MNKVVDIIDAIAHEKGLKFDDAKEAIKRALERTAKKVYGQQYNYKVDIDYDTKALNLFQIVLVVADDDERATDEENHISLSEAKSIDPDIEIDDELTYSLSLDNLGRTAAAILANEIEYHLQREIEQKLYTKFQEKVGKVVSGLVVRVDEEENTFIEIGELKTILPRRYRIKGEKFVTNDIVQAIVRKVFFDERKSMVVELSRTSPKFLEELLVKEVPEIAEGKVIIHKVARIPGTRAKIALSSIDSRIDPIGATVGTGGIRISSVSAQLYNENIDCIEHSSIDEIFVSRALSPAIIKSVEKISDEKISVNLPADQKAKAIGKGGINIRLASMLTGYEFEINEVVGSSMGETSVDYQTTSNSDALKNLFKD